MEVRFRFAAPEPAEEGEDIMLSWRTKLSKIGVVEVPSCSGKGGDAVVGVADDGHFGQVFQQFKSA